MNNIHITMSQVAGGVLSEIINSNDKILVFPDILSHGPIINTIDIHVWGDIRKQFWSKVFPGQEKDGNLSMGNYINYNEENIEEIGKDNIIIWFSDNVDEQLMFIWLVHHLVEKKISSEKMRYMYVTDIIHPNKKVYSLSSLNKKIFKDYIGKEKYLSSKDMSLIDKLWEVIVANDPVLLNNLLNKSTDDSGFLHDSVSYLRYRYPNNITGMDALNYRILKSCKYNGPLVRDIIMGLLRKEMMGIEELHDLLIFSIIKGFTSRALKYPLLTCETDSQELNKMKVRLTEKGENVLEGKENNIYLNVCDKWVGNVHLIYPSKIFWFYNRDDNLIESVRR